MLVAAQQPLADGDAHPDAGLFYCDTGHILVESELDHDGGTYGEKTRLG